MSGRPDVRRLDERLRLPASDGAFDEAELDGVPEAVRRYFRAAIAPGAPLARAAHLTMRGHIKLGSRWVPFRAEETLAPHQGFVWWGRAARVISGSDHLVDGHGVLDWRILGLVPVARGSGPDVTRSAAARGAAEAVWVPTALLPRFGVAWTASDDDRVTARLRVGDVDVEQHLTLDASGRVRSASLQRWGDPDESGSFDWHPFGMDATGHASFAGMTIPSAGRVGWHHGTDRWAEGEFFRFEITDLRPIAPSE